MYRLVVIDEKLEQFGIHGRFIRAYLSTHLLAHFERHASQETKQRDFWGLELNETKLRLLYQDIWRTAHSTHHPKLRRPSALLRNLAALELKQTQRLCNAPADWENFVVADSNEGSEEYMANFVEADISKKFNHVAWPFKTTTGDTWIAKVWQAWEAWIAMHNGDEDKALWKLQLAALKQLTQPTTPATPTVQQPRLFDFANATTAAM